MRRLLIVGAEVRNFPSIEWKDWASANPLDYQGLLLDCRKLQELPSQASISQILSALVKNNHTAYVILPEAPAAANLNGAMTLIPNYHLYVMPGTGQTLHAKTGDSLFEAYIGALTGHEIFLRLQLIPNT